jgi:hypothetical protein
MRRIVFLILMTLGQLFSFAQMDTSQIITPNIRTFLYKKDYKAWLDSSQDITSSLYYPVLLTRFLANDSSLSNAEVLNLMIGFTENPKYKPLEDMEIEGEIFEMTKDGRLEDALAKSLSYLKTHPLSLLVLRETSYAYGKLSRYYENNQIFDTAILYMDSSNYYMSLNDKIMEAMIYSGKGRTPDAPIFALGLADGEHFIPNVGYKIEEKDTEWNRNGDFVEKIKAADNLTAKTFYFVIQHAKQKIDDEKADELAAKKSKKDKKKEAEKKKEGSAFKSEKPDKKTKGKKNADFRIADSSGVAQQVTDTLSVANPTKTETTVSNPAAVTNESPNPASSKDSSGNGQNTSNSNQSDAGATSSSNNTQPQGPQEKPVTEELNPASTEKPQPPTNPENSGATSSEKSINPEANPEKPAPGN